MERKENLITFGSKVSNEWEALDKEKILQEILKSLEETRENHSNEMKISNQFGIYAFFIKPNRDFESCESLIQVWDIESFKKFPKVVKKRFNECVPTNDWYPFYIGKSEKLGSRIKEHLTHDSQHATYGLKLKDRTEFLENNEIEVGYWSLPEMEGVPREIKQFIITNFESRLRERMKPWIGKQ